MGQQNLNNHNKNILLHLVDFRIEADALKITHFYKGNMIYDNLRHKYDQNHIPFKVIAPLDYKSGALKWIHGIRSSLVDSNTGTNETDFIKRYLIYDRVKVLSYFEIAGLVLACDLFSPTVTITSFRVSFDIAMETLRADGIPCISFHRGWRDRSDG